MPAATPNACASKREVVVVGGQARFARLVEPTALLSTVSALVAHAESNGVAVVFIRDSITNEDPPSAHQA